MTKREMLEDSLMELRLSQAAIEQAPGGVSRFDEAALATIAAMIQQVEAKLRNIVMEMPGYWDCASSVTTR